MYNKSRTLTVIHPRCYYTGKATPEVLCGSQKRRQVLVVKTIPDIQILVQKLTKLYQKVYSYANKHQTQLTSPNALRAAAELVELNPV